MFSRCSVFLFAVAPGLFSAACSGNFYVDERVLATACETSAACGVGGVCDAEIGRCTESPGACSAEHPGGDCPVGRVCTAGVCACALTDGCDCPQGCLTVPTPWCDCQSEQGCIDGTCVTLADSNRCQPDRLDGACPGGEICVGGYCSTNEHPCGPVRPDGWCAAGLACVFGRCQPIRDRPCADAPGVGLCPAGTACDTTGACLPVACEPGRIGACEADEVCTDTGCTPVPCSTLHLAGACPAGQFCSGAGRCVDGGTCRVDADCATELTFCSVGELCLELGDCAGDEDCTSREADGLGQGYGCRAGRCRENLTCVLPTDCLPGKLCSVDGHCLQDGQCDGDADCDATHFCSRTGTCALRGTCLTHADCNTAAEQLCGRASGVCVETGACRADGDCPPAHRCDGTPGSCVPDTNGATACDSNTLIRGSCAPGALSCCDGSCCPTGERCSEGIGLCISQGDCVTSADCPPGYACTIDFTCTPSSDCFGGCDPFTERCNSDGTCLAWELCARDRDCPTGERCGPDWQCVPYPECGSQLLAAEALVPPNILFVLDRSGSMNVCGDGEAFAGQWCGHPGDNFMCCDDSSPANACEDCTSLTSTSCTTDAQCDSSLGAGDGVCSASGSCAIPCTSDGDCGAGGTCSCSLFDPIVCNNFGPGVCADAACVARTSTDVFGAGLTRWLEAVEVVNRVSTDNADRMAFGLSTYPHQCANTPDCWMTCNWLTCTADCDGDGQGNVSPGAIDVAVASGAQTAIATALQTTYPGGGTPTAATLRTILDDPAAAGLANPDRSNVVILVTDGQANGDISNVSICAPPCTDGIRNGSETDIDCGGACALIADGTGEPRTCADGEGCRANEDCRRGLCLDGVCRPPACANGVTDPLESDLDCGGPCLGCAPGAACDGASDCASGRCTAGRCEEPTCADTILNGTETGVDCGGGCPTCDDGESCVAGGDCASDACLERVCRPAHCVSRATDGDETGIDCGGSCPACPPAATCADGVRNGDETDVDCGGSVCSPCPGGARCTAAADCMSSQCEACGAVPPAELTLPSSAQNCRVDAALDGLFALDPTIRTFVVGFAFDTVNAALNCHAAHGRTSRCAGVTSSSCATQPTACYYEANDANSLTTRLETIFEQVATCTFGLLEEPQDPERLFVYFDWDDADSPPVDPQRMVREYHWHYDRALRQIELLGDACTQVREGRARPVVVRGCPPPGG